MYNRKKGMPREKPTKNSIIMLHNRVMNTQQPHTQQLLTQYDSGRLPKLGMAFPQFQSRLYAIGGRYLPWMPAW